MLEGICPEAVEILKDMPCPAGTFDILRRMAPMRQMEAAELMTGQSNYTATFPKAILAATPEAHPVAPRQKKQGREPPLSPTQIAPLERNLPDLKSKVTLRS